MRFKNFFIHAVNVHQGGGRSLLVALVSAVKGQVTLSVDERLTLSDPQKKNIQLKRVKPSILQRLLAERWLAKSVLKDDVVLCFGNLPPLFKLLGHTVVFMQNRYLIEDVSLNKFPFKVRLRLTVERLWLSFRLKNVDEFVVQTPTMKRWMEIKTRGRVPVIVSPFVADPRGFKRFPPQKKDQDDADYDFVYVASGEPHKNHHRLIDAWCLLAEEGLYPSLCLTLDEELFADLFEFIQMMRQRCHLNITNAGGLSHHAVLEMYKKSRAVIYPSKFESFGLPLIEARQAGLPVLASELDYVRDVLDPEQVFDPDSPVSIARAVKRFMGVDEKPLLLLNASQFLESLFESVSQ